ncbi:flavin reductase family protein [Ornithinimicrobium faecis]|uniref:Flavin reductase family protein n=1 Tax=Ornithinimicrobium faecis TaxID=2934158 RepID=A0ABY4YTU0_9MICO|nr:flavin reductase family protein [Ornithinimicrobium sp. HY1793]USQ80144.1 flavin reductase family protein [Ornithinimicrobium sp. HY1793]
MSMPSGSVSPSPRVIYRPGEEGVNSYGLLTSIILPRPIAWVSTIGADGVGNLAPHSFFSVASASPPVVSFTSVGRKDSLANVLATEEFVVNIVSTDQLEQCNGTSAEVDSSVDEAALLGIALEPSDVVAPPRVAGSPASIECTLHSTVEVGDSVIILGLVQAITVQERVLSGRHVDAALLDPLSRLGGPQWGTLGEIRSLRRPRPEDVLPD